MDWFDYSRGMPKLSMPYRLSVNHPGSYFRFNDPVSLVWRVDEGSARRYIYMPDAD